MGFEIPGFKLGTQVANADLDNRYRFVAVGTNGKIAQASTAGGRVDGVIQTPAKSGTAVEVMTSGVTKLVAGAAIASCGPITTDNQGRAITAVTTGHHILGTALETAAAAGEVIAVLLDYKGVV